MEKILVTGAMGFVGSHWCEHLLQKGKFVYGFDLGLKNKKLLEYDNFIFIQDTVKDFQLLERLVKEVDCVCHFAGIAEPRQYIESPRKVIDITAIVGLKIIDMCRYMGKLFFLTSTSEIYGKSPNIPFKEDDDRVLGSTAKHRWCYSTSKALLEHYLEACAQSRELDFIIVRLFNVYGPYLKGRVVSNFVENALEGKDLIVEGNGSQTRCFTYIDDMIEAFDLLCNTPKCRNNVFNVGNPVESSIVELAETTIDAANSSSKIIYKNHGTVYGRKYEDIPRRVPDITKISNFTGWEPKTDLSTGLRKYVENIRKNEVFCE